MIVSCAIRREASASCRELSFYGFFHHGKFNACTISHGMSAANRLCWSEFTEANCVRIEQPYSGRPRHGKNSCFRIEHNKTSCSDVHSYCTYATFAFSFSGSQQSGSFGPVIYFDAEFLELVVQSRFEGGSPNPQSISALIIVSKHELGFIIAEFRTFELVLGITDLTAEGFHVNKSVPAFAAGNILIDAVAVVVLLVYICLSDFLWRYS